MRAKKIPFDKYYTPIDIVEKTIQKAKEYIGLENITEFLEPSAGNGAFLDSLEKLDKPILSYDILPEDNRIIKQDFLTLDLEYKKGRCIIGNPPFGKMHEKVNYLTFYKKSLSLGDYIVFILPISQLNNCTSLYDFDLIYSEDLGENIVFTDRKLHCCLNIYKRNKNGKLNKKKKTKIKDIEFWNYLRSSDRKKHYKEDYNLHFCNWGCNIIGKFTVGEKYAQEIWIKCDKEKEELIINFVNNYDWKQKYKTSNKSHISQENFKRLLLDNIKELEEEVINNE